MRKSHRHMGEVLGGVETHFLTLISVSDLLYGIESRTFRPKMALAKGMMVTIVIQHRLARPAASKVWESKDSVTWTVKNTPSPRLRPSFRRCQLNDGRKISSFPSTTTIGSRVVAMSPPSAPSAPPAPAAKHSPPSAEALCLKTFGSCWFLDKDWLISFIASAQRLKPDAPITWVEFVPKGHTHLVRCALKLIPPTRALPLAKVKECMFSFILEVLNGPGGSPGFFNARKAAKPRKRTRKRKGKGEQSADMAVDAPEPRMAAGGSTREPEALRGDGDPPPLEGSSEPTACTQHFPGPSSEEPRDGGSSSEDPRASLSPTSLPVEPVLQAPVAALALSHRALKLLRSREKMAAQRERSASRSPSPAPSISSVLGKHSPPSPPPPTSPPPALGSPVSEAALDWRAWMQHKRALFHQNNPGKSVPVTVTPLDLRNAASAAAAAPRLASPFSPLTSLTSDRLRSPSPLSLPSRMSPESEERTPTLCAVGRPP